MSNLSVAFAMHSNTTLHENYGNNSREELINILSLFQKISLAAPYFIIEPLALFLNFLTLYILRKKEAQSCRRIRRVKGHERVMARPQCRSFYFLRHLVFSDLLTCFVAIPFDALEIYRLEFRRSREYCAISKYVRFVAISSSFYILVVINFERFWSVTFPFRPLGHKMISYMTRGTWIAAFVINIPSLFLYRSKVEFMYNDDRYYVRVCVAEPGQTGNFARGFLGVTFLIPALAIATLSLSTLYHILKIQRKNNQRGSSMEKSLSELEELKGLRNIILSSFYITVGFWLCSSPVGFYYLIIAGIGRPEFPTSYLIGRSIVIIANLSAVVNPLVTILCFRPIKEGAREYLGLGTKKCYRITNLGAQTKDDKNHVELLAVTVRSSLRHVRYILQKREAEEKNLQRLGKDTSEPTVMTTVPHYDNTS